MATTRTPLQPAPALEAFHCVGCHVYLVRYRAGQEDLARESIARWVRNRDLAFTWTDAAAMGEQIPHEPEADDEPDCDCDACRLGHNHRLIAELRSDNRTMKRLIGTVLILFATAIYFGSR